MEPNYRLLSAILLLVATMLVSSAPAIAALLPQTGPYAWISVVFGFIVIGLREWIKEKGQTTETA